MLAVGANAKNLITQTRQNNLDLATTWYPLITQTFKDLESQVSHGTRENINNQQSRTKQIDSIQLTSTALFSLFMDRIKDQY